MPQGIDESLSGFMSRHPQVSTIAAISSSPPALVIAVSGELGHDIAPDFHSTIGLLLPAAASLGGLILDLGGVSYISSSGIGTLTSLLVESKRMKLRLELARATSKVRDIIDLLGFASFFTFIEDYEAGR
ncbi:MAG: STAS domain-containing protein [Spirochaetaceae bacterium]|nr:STAS domain-containing protein [Spirochaetaceae bacterium]